MASVPTHAIDSEVTHTREAGLLEAGSMSVVRHYEQPPPPQRWFGAGWPASGWIAGAIVGGALFGVSVGWLASPRTTGSPASRIRTEAIAFPVQTSLAAETIAGVSSQTVVPVSYPTSGAETSKFSASVTADLDAIKIRNRRLEALVKVLRRRAVAERRTTPPASPND